MDSFTNDIEKDSQVRTKINIMLDIYNRLPSNCQAKIGYDCLIQNVVLEELINFLGTTITDLNMELKMKIGRINYLESR